MSDTQDFAGDPALLAPTVNTTPGPEYADTARLWQGIPGIERTRGGRLWATWYSGGTTEGPYNYVVLVTSDDDGKSWSGPQLVIDPPGFVRAFDPCLWTDPSGRLWLFWAQALGHWDGRAGVFAITCSNPDADSPVWTEPRRLCNGIMMNKPLVLTTGEWLLPVAIWRWGSGLAKTNTDLKLGLTPEQVKAGSHDMGTERGSNVVVSEDQGKTFRLLGQAHDPRSNCDEHMIAERKDGSLWMLIRTDYGIGESTSTDRGKTWTPGQPSGIPHPVTRFFLRRLASGRLLMVRHGEQAGTHRSHLQAYLSDDDGKTWVGGLLLDARGGVSYPDGTQGPDGTIYLIYDYSRGGDREILLATFKEEDILAGKPVTNAVRLRNLVNRPPVVMRSNADGEPLAGPGAHPTSAAEADVATFGALLFTDRTYRFEHLPEQLVGKAFLRSSIGGCEAQCTADGYVWVLTPSEGRNRDSLEKPLLQQGFTKVALREFRLFDGMPNACSVFQKRLTAGDKLQLGKWSVVLFDPQ